MYEDVQLRSFVTGYQAGGIPFFNCFYVVSEVAFEYFQYGGRLRRIADGGESRHRSKLTRIFQRAQQRTVTTHAIKTFFTKYNIKEKKIVSTY